MKIFNKDYYCGRNTGRIEGLITARTLLCKEIAKGKINQDSLKDILIKINKTIQELSLKGIK